MMCNFNLAIMFSIFGPYILARLNAVAKKTSLLGIQGAYKSSVYDWDKIEAKQNFRQITLFKEGHIDGISMDEIEERLVTIFGSYQPDVIVIPGWSNRWAIALLSWSIKNNVPAVLMSESTCHDTNRVWWREYVKRRIVKQYSAALVGGRAHVDYVVKLGIPRKRIFTGYNAVDNEYFKKYVQKACQEKEKWRSDLGLPEHYFFASNRFVEKKNLVRLIEAYAQYRQQADGEAWNLVLLGDGNLRENLEHLIKMLGLQSYIQMPGFKQYDVLPVYYGLAGAFIHASTVEPWGLVVNEAMASGLPVIVSERCGCASDLVENGLNGYTFDPYNVKVLAELMTHMASDSCDTDAMGRASGEIIDQWGPQKFADNLLMATQVASSVGRPERNWIDRVILWVFRRV